MKRLTVSHQDLKYRCPMRAVLNCHPPYLLQNKVSFWQNKFRIISLWLVHNGWHFILPTVDRKVQYLVAEERGRTFSLGSQLGLYKPNCIAQVLLMDVKHAEWMITMLNWTYEPQLISLLSLPAMEWSCVCLMPRSHVRGKVSLRNNSSKQIWWLSMETTELFIGGYPKVSLRSIATYLSKLFLACAS